MQTMLKTDPSDSLPRSGTTGTDPDELRARIALVRASGFGAVKAGRLLNWFGSASEVYGASDHELLRIEGMTTKAVESLRRSIEDVSVERDRRFAVSDGLELVSYLDPVYPDLLRSIYAPPALLWTTDASFMDSSNTEPAVAIVGTRRPSPAGKSMAYAIAYELAQNGITIVSGLAYGIDSVAHRAALDAGGRTVAVLGSGLRRVYPKRNRPLAQLIGQHGCLVSEFPLDMAAQPGHFPRRNRIISGLSSKTVVVEAYEGGGALLTAKLALDQNRDVYAVPGLLGNPAALGTNRLIQLGEAQILTRTDELLHDLVARSDKAPEDERGVLKSQSKLLVELSLDPIHIDDLSDRTQRETSDLLIDLLRLECSGLIRQLPGKYFVLAPTA